MPTRRSKSSTAPAAAKAAPLVTPRRATRLNPEAASEGGAAPVAQGRTAPRPRKSTLDRESPSLASSSAPPIAPPLVHQPTTARFGRRTARRTLSARSGSSGGGSEGDLEGCEGLQAKLDALRHEKETSASLVRDPEALARVYQERLRAFEDGVDELVASGEGGGGTARGRKQVTRLCPTSLQLSLPLSLWRR